MFLLSPAPPLLHGTRHWQVPIPAGPCVTRWHRMMGTVVAGGICQLPWLLRGAGTAATAATAGGSSPFVSCCQMFLCKIIPWKNREGRTFFSSNILL